MTTATVLVLGGTGIFGMRIAQALADTSGLRVVITGRDAERGAATAAQMGAEFLACDLSQPGTLDAALERLRPTLLVHCAGPFQGRGYDVARACLAHGAHYLDLADGREFVSGIHVLDEQARDRGLVVGSGASSAPTITYALVRELVPEFERIDELQIALSPGNQNPRGAATLGAVLGYLGETQRVFVDGAWTSRPGWGDRRRLDFPPSVGRRDVYACDVPDLDLFPPAFDARSVRFHAGLELGVLNGLLTGLRFLRSARLVPSLERCAPLALRLSMLLYRFGSKNGALAVWARGPSATGGGEIERRIALVTDDDGPATPSSPGILLARKLLLGEGLPTGAAPCMGWLTLDELLEHLEPLGIWCEQGAESGWKRRTRGTL
jgi:hypothetical protein